ncbi:hypothetical protein BIW11_12858 [Tropilaelaps mercedesae]|uniref:Uncharacterized protein n=1 Tax=Tropilaelaps mercedesae TaxID=418985 RepID=A0A1V9X5G5_9ACAR|nr:hypothetical protein BIW11_12858 [Tropilaelaps mercedesae]
MPPFSYVTRLSSEDEQTIWYNSLDGSTAVTQPEPTQRTHPGMPVEEYINNNENGGNINHDQSELGLALPSDRFYSSLLDMAPWSPPRVQELLQNCGLYDPPRVPQASQSNHRDNADYFGLTLPLLPDVNDSCNSIDAGPAGSPAILRKLKSSPRFSTKSIFNWGDVTDAVVVGNLSRYIVVENQGSCESFVRDTLLRALNLGNEHVTIVQGKIPDMIYLFDMSATDMDRVCGYVQNYFSRLLCETRMVYRLAPRHEPGVTALILDVLDQENRSGMSYTDLFKQLNQIPLTVDLPFDKKCLQEVLRGGRPYSIQRNPLADPIQAKLLLSSHPVMVISLRKLAPVVHAMLSSPSIPYLLSPPATPGRTSHDVVPVDHAFLDLLQSKLFSVYGTEELVAESGTGETNYVFGEGQPKATEYLISCVPGVEVLYVDGQKYIRKMDLSERSFDRDSAASPVPRFAQKYNAASNCANNDDPVKKLVQTITAILKEAKNQYMTLMELDSELRKITEVPPGFLLRDFITEHVKFYQLLTLGQPELVTLSHRGQIKRISNDMQKVLRRLNARFVTTATLPTAFMDLWENCDNAGSRPNGDRQAKFDISRFGVCFLDDIMVTIPQNWGIHCSAYVSNCDGRLMAREYGEGEDDVPAFVKLPSRTRTNALDMIATAANNGDLTILAMDAQKAERIHSITPHGIVFAWAPRSRISDNQQRNLALFRQQLLNMYRGDPSAARVKELIESWEPRNTIENDRLKRLDTACLRANIEQPARMRRRFDAARQDSEADAEHRHHVPCDFKLHFNQFIPTFHHVYNAQATVSRYGVKTLFEAFELINETIQLSHAEAQAAMIQLTPEAKREVLERRLVYLMRHTDGPIDYNRLLAMYMSEPTMRVYAHEAEIKEALKFCNLLDIRLSMADNCIITVKPAFQFTTAVNYYGEDITHLLLIFMRSFTWLSFAELQRQFENKHNRLFSLPTLSALFELGAIRRVTNPLGPPETAMYDLQEVCRIVRNLIHQMNNRPDATYHLYEPRNDTDRLMYGHRDDRSLTFLLEHSGDCMYADFDVDGMMKDWSEFFVKLDSTDRRVKSSYKLHECVIIGAPEREDQDQQQPPSRRNFRPRALQFNCTSLRNSNSNARQGRQHARSR